jgi:formamidopyrimidine-DNA glycosylase
MPELPELEAFVRAVDEPVAAAPIDGPPEAHFAVLKTADPPLATLGGRRFEGAMRRGKYLLFPVDDGTTLAVHLMSGGRVAYTAPGEKRPGNAVLTVKLADGGALLVIEGGRRKNVRVHLARADALGQLLEGLGPEPLEPEFDRAALDGVLDAKPRQLNSLLRDQRAVAGIGRAFADEILHAAQLSPFAISNRLDDDARQRLLVAIRAVLGAAVLACAAKQGTRLPTKNDARPLQVHGRDGQPCPRCGATLGFVDFESNRIVYCAACQTGGRELADRLLSRLLR